ncbi:MAG: leucine--tRNA ligase [Candidatus Doudnabacteria bacterium]|nr:leucine--tRNA ligase [Candidatus Doudnabacteria bacterium]
MGKRYNHKKIEKYWQKHWEAKKFWRAQDFSSKKKYYALVEFPYPSGEGLHVGHVRTYTAIDAIARFRRMNGHNVLFPIGFDAFGLPTENFAIKNKIHPRLATRSNIKIFTRQLKSLGLSFDWSRAVDTTDPLYYKWTQWIFLQLYARGLAYRAEIPINWCPNCKTGLANEEVVNGRHERCGTEVVKKLIKQWLIKITKYADRLIDDLRMVDFPERVKTQQINWIGKSEGAEIEFPLAGHFNFVLLHGYTGSAKKNFFPWLKTALEKRGYRVIAPELPHSSRPVEKEQVEFVLKNVKFDENTIILGHSLGGPVAVKAVERLSTRVAGLVFAGGFLEPKFKDHPRPYEKDFVWRFNLKEVRKKVGFVKVLSDRNDYAVPVEQGEKLARGLAGEFFAVESQEPHFTSDQEPAILEHLVPKVKTFTTRADTLFGATYLVLAPENPIVASYLAMRRSGSGVWNLKEAAAYVERAMKKTDISRTAEEREKTGVELKGLRAKHPLTGRTIPIWVADYVLASYGTGAIMAVPAHDERDFVFAKKFKLPILQVIKPPSVDSRDDLPPPSAVGRHDIDLEAECWTGEGTLVNSGKYTGSDSVQARKKIALDLQAQGLGRPAVSYKLRDWIFSRQHYWGEPIPIIYCDHCGAVPVPEKDLPVLLPNVKHYEPTKSGESPLAAIKSFVNTNCPACARPARRETDTMPNWAGSNWYFIRYTDPKNAKEFAARNKLEYWMGQQSLDAAASFRSPKGVGGVDLYNGGMEHTTLHLLYSRFIYKFLFDQKLVPGPEPYAKRTSHGVILGEDGRKMSKSFGNVINPDQVVAEHGADTLRLYEMFLAPFGQMVPWDTRGVLGARRFLDRVWRVYHEKPIRRGGGELSAAADKTERAEELERLLHKTIKKVTADLEDMKFNTAVSALMILINKFDENVAEVTSKQLEIFLLLLAPFAPYLAEELWRNLGNKKSVHLESWPRYEEALIAEQMLKIPVSINGRVRDVILVPADLTQNEIENQALNSPKIEAHIAGKTILRRVYVSGKMINFVVE